MIVYTIGFTKKSARRFFETIKEHGVEMLIDIRLNNSSQLAGFSKGEDLQYFLKEICNCALRPRHDICSEQGDLRRVPIQKHSMGRV